MAVVDHYSEINANLYRNMYAGFYIGGAQSFNGTGGTLDSAKFYLKKGSSNVPGVCYAKIYAMSGTYGNGDNIPTGSALAISDSRTANDFNTSEQLETFTFTGGNKITLTNGTKYVVSFEYNNGDSVNKVLLGHDSSGEHTGNASYYISSWIAGTSGDDVCFYVYDDSPSTSTTSSSSSTSTTSLSTSTTSSSTSSTSTSTSTTTLAPSCVKDVSNEAVTNINFTVGTTIAQKRGQSFVADLTGKLCEIQVQIMKYGSPTDNVLCNIYSHNSGSNAPDTLLGSADNVFDGSTLPTSPGTTKNFSFLNTGVNISSGTTYWVVVSRSETPSDTNYYAWRGSNSLTYGKVRVWNGTDWTTQATSALGMWFIEYTDSSSTTSTTSSSTSTTSSSSSTSMTISTTSSSISTSTTSSSSTSTTSSSSSISTTSSSTSTTSSSSSTSTTTTLISTSTTSTSSSTSSTSISTTSRSTSTTSSSTSTTSSSTSQTTSTTSSSSSTSTTSSSVSTSTTSSSSSSISTTSSSTSITTSTSTSTLWYKPDIGIIDTESFSGAVSYV